MKIVEMLKPPIDLLIVNGDLIDGRGEASGGTELITPDRTVQAEMAVAALEVWEPRKVVVSIGTPYHTGKTEDWEKTIASVLGGKAYSHPFLDVEGVVFDCKHKVGRSSVSYGRGTPLAKERDWNLWWFDRGGQPKADIILRSHVHYFAYIGGAGWLAVNVPPLETGKSKYGQRQNSGMVDWGLVKFDVDGGAFTWEPYTRQLKANNTEAIKI
jgi:hypothetical protein